MFLVERGHAPSRTKAQEMIRSGKIKIYKNSKYETCTKPNAEVDENSDIQITEVMPFVSRAGVKLDGAIKHVGLQVSGLSAIDIGISTGGFTDCLLQRGAKSILGVDVGHGQLASKLSQDPRVRLLEETNARFLLDSENFQILDKKEFQILVADVSFISIKMLIPIFFKLLGEGGVGLCLIKPQFEVGPENLGKGGIVRDVSLYPILEKSLREEFTNAGFQVMDYFPSSLDGKDGNREFFIYIKKTHSNTSRI